MFSTGPSNVFLFRMFWSMFCKSIKSRKGVTINLTFVKLCAPLLNFMIFRKCADVNNHPQTSQLKRACVQYFYETVNLAFLCMIYYISHTFKHSDPHDCELSCVCQHITKFVLGIDL